MPALLLLRNSVTALSLLIVAGAILWYANRPEPVAVRVHEVTRGTVEETAANTRVGSVKACKRSRLSPAMGGQIATIQIHDGEKVEKGQLLLSLWNQDLQARLKLATAQIKTARAQARAVCLRAAQARREAARLSRLRQRNLVSVDAVDQASTKAKSLHQECEAARTRIDIQKAQRDLAQAQLDKTHLYAPFDGIVAKVIGEKGEYITPSPPGVATPPAVDLISVDCFYVSAPIDEIDSGRIEPGMETRIHIDAFGDRRFPGRLRRIAPYVLEVEKQARTVEVEVDFLDQEDEARQRPGYSADVEIVLARRLDVLRIPTESLMEGQRVLILKRGRLEERKIETGLSNWEWTEVTLGLGEGEKVVLSLDREGVKAGVPAIAEKSP